MLREFFHHIAESPLPSLGWMDTNPVAGAHLIRRDINPLVIDRYVTVVDQLPGGGAGWREACPVDDVVEAKLKESKERITGIAPMRQGALEVCSKLSLEQSIHFASLLLLAELNRKI